jgi:hypothetical protein
VDLFPWPYSGSASPTSQSGSRLNGTKGKATLVRSCFTSVALRLVHAAILRHSSVPRESQTVASPPVVSDQTDPRDLRIAASLKPAYMQGIAIHKAHGEEDESSESSTHGN